MNYELWQNLSTLYRHFNYKGEFVVPIMGLGVKYGELGSFDVQRQNRICVQLKKEL